MKLIDKSALVAEIDRLITELVEEGEDTMFEQGRISAFEDVKVFINHTLEVKEVDSTDAFIEKACNYLFSHMGLFATFFDDDIVEDIERSEFIKKFRIAMEGKL